MTFNIIGTGNMAWFLAGKLAAAGHICLGIYGRNSAAAQTLADTLHCHAYNTFDNIKEADACIIAVSDHVIDSIATQLSFKETVVLHTAGAVNANILSGTSPHYGALWPIYSIIKSNPVDNKNIPIAWEGSTERAQNIIETIGKSISGNLFMLSSDQRKWLHLSAVLCNNFTNHLFTISEELCNTRNIPFELLYPLILQTIERILEKSPYELQTGPAKRGDEMIMNSHADMLQNADWQEVYKAMSHSIQNMYKS
jgi:predicted short-subunit dehydrogenase-like oxidoreductase (DUF2520 family)